MVRQVALKNEAAGAPANTTSATRTASFSALIDISSPNPDIRDCGSPLGVSGKPAAFPRERTSSSPSRDPYRHPRATRESFEICARGLWLTRACSTRKTATNWTRTGAAGIVRRLKRPCRRNRPNDHRRQSQSRRARGGSERSRRLLDAVHAEPRLQETPAPHLALEGHALLHPGGPRDSGRFRGALVLQCGPQSRADCRCDPAPGGRARFHPDLPVRPSFGVPALLATRRSRAGRPRSRLLLQLRSEAARAPAWKLGIAYHNVRGRGREAAADRARARLPRRRLRRHFGRRHGQQPQVLRPR